MFNSEIVEELQYIRGCINNNLIYLLFAGKKSAVLYLQSQKIATLKSFMELHVILQCFPVAFWNFSYTDKILNLD